VEESEYVELVHQSNAGDRCSRERLFAALYSELHRIADRELRRHSALALSATTVLHETFLTMRDRHVVFPNYRRFIAYAAHVMRGLVIDFMRSRQRQKRGGAFEMTSLADAEDYGVDPQYDLEHLRDALESLAAIDRRLAECIDLKFFCGYSFNDIARLWDVSERTVQRDWEKARLLLYRLIEGTSQRCGDRP
jgi:RNA polymerase sigma factor (TIGR02999 family)